MHWGVDLDGGEKGKLLYTSKVLHLLAVFVGANIRRKLLTAGAKKKKERKRGCLVGYVVYVIAKENIFFLQMRQANSHIRNEEPDGRSRNRPSVDRNGAGILRYFFLL